MLFPVSVTTDQLIGLKNRQPELQQYRNRKFHPCNETFWLQACSLLNVDGCMQVVGGVGVSNDGGSVVVVVVVVVVCGTHMSGFMTHLQHMSKRCLQHESGPLQRKKSHVQSAEIEVM